MKSNLSAILLVSILIFTSCFSDQAKYGYTPTSAGQLDEVLWVMDEEMWLDNAGQLIKENLRKEYKVLPQAEPEYLLREKTYEQFDNDIIKKYRTIILTSYNNDKSRLNQFIRSTFSKKMDQPEASGNQSFLVRDIWAKPQVVMVIYAESKDQLVKAIQSELPNILRTIRKEEDGRIQVKLFENGLNSDAVDYIKEQFDFALNIPKDFYIAKKNSDYGWLRKETAELSSNIMVYEKDLSQEDLSQGVDWKKYSKQLRNYLGREHIASTVEGTFMEIEERFAKVLQDTTGIGDIKALQTKGLWRIEGDFMGGPFVNYMWLDADKNKLYMLDGFVHAPKGDKKKYMRELENIFNTLKTNPEYSAN